MFRNQGARFLVQPQQIVPTEDGGVVKRESPLFASEFGRGAIGFALDDLQPPPGLLDGLAAAIDLAAEEQGIGKPGDASPQSRAGGGESGIVAVHSASPASP